MIQLGEVFLRLGSSSSMPPKYWLPRKTAGLTGFSSGFLEATNRGPVTSFIRIRSFLTGTGSNSLDGWGLVNYLFLPTSFYLLYAESHTTIFGFHVSALRCYSPGCVHCKLFCRKYKSVDSSKSRYRYCQSLKLFDFHGFSHVNASGLLWLLGQSRSQQIPLLLIIAIYSSFQEMNALV